MRNLTIDTRVRPGRIAVLVDINDNQWQNTCLRVVEYFTRQWGGCGNIIIPTNGEMIGPLFWRVLERFDPDYLLAYGRTGQDIEIEKPAEFEKAYQRRIAAWEKQIEGGETNSHVVDAIRNNVRQERLSQLPISPRLQGELKERLAPFYFQQFTVEPGSLSAGSVPHHPQTDIVDILPYAEHTKRILRISNNAPFAPLWWASSFGWINAKLEAELAKIDIASFERGNSEDDVKLLIELAVKSYEGIESARFLTDIPLDAIQDVFRCAPSRLSMIGLTDYRSIRHQNATELVVAVAGLGIEDFCLYYALSRMRSRAVWIPPSVSEELLGPVQTGLRVDATWHFVNDLSSLAMGNSQRYAGLKLVSATLSAEQLNQVKARLSALAINELTQCQIETPPQALPDHPIRYYEMNNVSVLRSFAVPDDGMIRLFETPVPRSFAKVNPHKHRWLAELNVRQYQMPRHYALGERFLNASSSKDARVSSVGPTYFCPSWMIMGGASAESSVTRPTVHIPEPLEIFQAVARSSKLSCTISDKGFYAGDACQKFGGLDNLARFLRSRSGQLFVSAFLDKTKPKENDHLKGVLLGNDRRYLDLDSLAAILENEEEAANLLDRLSSEGVLYRGFVLQCQYCRRADWFPLSALTDEFTCNRCHRAQVFTHAHWRHPNQPHLYYQLDELVYLGLEQNMHVPLLALDALQRSSSDSFLYVHELAYAEMEKEIPPCELDLNCVVDGSLTIGEAKKHNRLGKNEKEESEAISKYLSLANRLCVHQVVFATASDQWHPSTAKRIVDGFKGERFSVELLTQKQLYGDAVLT